MSVKEGHCEDGKYDLHHAESSGKFKPLKEFKSKSKSRKPNYFLGLQVSNPNIHKHVVEVQKNILACNKVLSDSFIDVATLHLTLLVIHIDSDEELHMACSALDHCGAELNDDFSKSPLTLRFKSLSHFSNEVVFAKIVENDDFSRLKIMAAFVKDKFIAMGINVTDLRDFKAHLTIAKMSNMPFHKKKSIKKIDPAYYSSYTDVDFGDQMVTGIQLLKMDETKDEKRYYQKPREARFALNKIYCWSYVISNESLDHSQCCFPQQSSLI